MIEYFKVILEFESNYKNKIIKSFLIKGGIMFSEHLEIILAQQGNNECMENLVKKYQGLVYQNGKKIFLKDGTLDDIFQEGFIGLIKAIRSYDSTKNAAFSTFASLCIRRNIISAIKYANSEKFKILNLAIYSNSDLDGSWNPENVFYHQHSNLSYFKSDEILLTGEQIEFLNNNLKLSPFEKKVFKYLISQYTYVEISKFLNENSKKIDNTIQRIKKKLRICLDIYKSN